MIISGVSIAKKYATAYLNVHQDKLSEADINSMATACDFFKKHHDFMHLLCVVSMDKAVMPRVFTKLIHDFDLPKSAYLLMNLLVKYKHVCYLREVLQDVCSLYKMRKNILELEIKTADQLDAHAVQAFKAFFAKESGRRIESKVTIDRSLIAGVRLQSDFYVWEYSIASRIRALKHKLVIEG